MLRTSGHDATLTTQKIPDFENDISTRYRNVGKLEADPAPHNVSHDQG